MSKPRLTVGSRNLWSASSWRCLYTGSAVPSGKTRCTAEEAGGAGADRSRAESAAGQAGRSPAARCRADARKRARRSDLYLVRMVAATRPLEAVTRDREHECPSCTSSFARRASAAGSFCLARTRSRSGPGDGYRWWCACLVRAAQITGLSPPECDLRERERSAERAPSR